MRLATFVSPDYRPITAPRPGRCCSARCRSRATVELTSAAGPGGEYDGRYEEDGE